MFFDKPRILRQYTQEVKVKGIRTRQYCTDSIRSSGLGQETPKLIFQMFLAEEIKSQVDVVGEQRGENISTFLVDEVDETRKRLLNSRQETFKTLQKGNTSNKHPARELYYNSS